MNRKAGDHDPMITAAGGLPGETVKGWRIKAPNTYDCDFGFSCMGYEIAAGWGHAMADPDATPDRDGRRRLVSAHEFRHLLVGPHRATR